MYRDASPSLEETIARLEAEVRQLRALGGKQRERRLILAAVVGMMIAIHSIIGCVATKLQSDRLQRDAYRRLEGRTTDLVTCARTLSTRIDEIDTCRTHLAECRDSAITDRPGPTRAAASIAIP